MTLRKATVLLICLGSLTLFLTLALATRLVIEQAFLDLEMAEGRKDVERAKNAVREELHKLDETLMDWAVWDDSHQFMRGRGKNFIASNLNDRTLSSLRLQAILFINPEGRVLWAQGFDVDRGVRAHLPEGLLDRLQPGSSLLGGKTSEDRVSGIMLLPQGPLLAAACPILDSEGRGPAAGTLVMARQLGARETTELAERLRLPLSLERADSPPAPDLALLENVRPGQPETQLAPISEDIFAGMAVIPDIWGQPGLRVVVRSTRDIVVRGEAAIRNSMVLLGACGLVFLAALLMFLERRVLSRLARLGSQVAGIDTGAETLGRVDVPGGDELSALAGRINMALSELERSRQILAVQCRTSEEQESFLQSLLDTIQAGIMLVDPLSHRIVEVNAFAAAAAGRPREELLGQLCHGLICPNTQGQCPITDLGKSGEQAVRKLVRADGSRLAVLKSVRRIDRGGKELLLETFIDVDDLHKAQEALRRSEETYRTIFMNTGTAMNLMEEDTTISLCNQEFEKLSGYARAEVEGRMSWTEFFAPEDVERMLRHHIKRRQSPELAPRNYETRFIARGGEARHVVLTVSMIPGTRTSVASIEDITDRKKAEEMLQHQAFHDSLTGLPNRLLLQDRLDRAVESARRDGVEAAVLLMDLDRFKDINDSLGHSTGDALLKLVAERLHASVRRRDTVARLGGDEFVVVMDGPISSEAAGQVARHILEGFETPFELGGRSLHVGLSMGLTMFPGHGDSPETLLKNADLAMYRAKERGRNTYAFFTQDLNSQALHKLMVETGLRRALATGGIEVHYQPKLVHPGRRLAGAEALVRWRREDGALVPPAEFIPVAEDTGLILPLSDLVLREACERARIWRAFGHPDFVMAVNLSPRLFLDKDLATRIQAIVEASGLAPEALEFEITENILLATQPETLRTLDQLAGMGAAIVLDDFGKEYSSLGYVKKLPIEAIKIDRSFISSLPESEDDAAIVKTILDMAATLELRVVAEGVETEAQLEFLTALGCREFQGYLFGRPMPAAQFDALVNPNRPEAAPLEKD